MRINMIKDFVYIVLSHSGWWKICVLDFSLFRNTFEIFYLVNRYLPLHANHTIPISISLHNWSVEREWNMEFSVSSVRIYCDHFHYCPLNNRSVWCLFGLPSIVATIFTVNNLYILTLSTIVWACVLFSSILGYHIELYIIIISIQYGILHK